MKVDIVIPRERHSWNLGEGWVQALERKGVLGRAFRLAQDGEAAVLEHAPREESDLIILMGGDHHLIELHNTERKRDLWQRSRVPKLAVCYESIIDSRFPGSFEKSVSATEAFTHFAYCDEKDETFFADRNASAFWLPQCVDHHRFVPCAGERRPQVFFRGKGDASWGYDLRPRLIERLKRCPAFVYIAEELSDEQLMRAFSEYACSINLPGNFFGYNVRTFEALAAGAILFQHRVPDRPRNEALFDDRHLIAYSADDMDALEKKMCEVTQNPGDYREMAERGREACLAAHTIDHRIEEVITFVDRSYKAGTRLHVGCGANVIPNHVNIDTASGDARVVVAELGRLDGIPDRSCETIYACDVLARLGSDASAGDALKAWAGKLRQDGRLYLSEPCSVFRWGGDRIRQCMGGEAAGPQVEALRKSGLTVVQAFDPRTTGFARWDAGRRWPRVNLVARAVSGSGA